MGQTWGLIKRRLTFFPISMTLLGVGFKRHPTVMPCQAQCTGYVVIIVKKNRVLSLFRKAMKLESE